MKKRITFVVALLLLLTTIFVLPLTNTVREQEEDKTIYKSALTIKDTVNANQKTEFISKDENNTLPYQSSDIVIITAELSTAPLADSFLQSNEANLQAYLSTKQAKELLTKIKNEQEEFISELEKNIGKNNVNQIKTTSVVMNSVSFRCTYGKLAEIKKFKGVKRAYVSIELIPYEDLDKEKYTILNENIKTTDETDDSNKENDDVELNGSGIITAILDTGFDINHDVFSVDAENGKYSQDDFMYLLSNIQICNDGEFAPTELYISQKILYAYDYADNDNDVLSKQSEHGTMVAGIASGSTENISSASNAYDSQLLMMKCSTDTSKKADSTTILSAIEDSLILGADIINISYGETEILNSDFAASFGDMFKRIYKCGTSIVMPSGNLGTTDSESIIENGTSSPIASLSGVISVSSAEDSTIYTPYFIIGENQIEYTLPKYSNGRSDYSFYNLIEGDYEYVVYDEDSENCDYTNKIVFVNDDEESVESLINIAGQKKALAIVIFGDEKTELIEGASVPIAIVHSTELDSLEVSGEIQISENYISKSENESYAKISDNASYGSNGSMSINPMVTEISPSYSSIPNNHYSTTNGSSFASALVSGKIAILKQYINSDKRFAEYSAEQKNDLVYKLITSTTDIISERNSSVSETVRTQGSGLINLNNALSTNAYISSGFTVIGSSEVGFYELSFDITNISDKAISFNPSISLATDRFDRETEKKYPAEISKCNYIAKFSVDNKEVDEISVEANETKKVTLKIKLNSVFILEQIPDFSEGFYFDGYVYLTQKDGVTLTTSLLGFVGDYTEKSAFDDFVYDNNEKITNQSSYLYLSTNNNNLVDNSMILGYNKFTEEFDENNISFNSKTLETALNESSISDVSLYVRTLAKRNLFGFKCTVKNENGTIIYESEAFNRNRNSSGDVSTSINTALSSLPDGKYTLTISGRVEESTEKFVDQSREFKFTVDSKNPTKTSYRTYFSDKKTYLEITGYDNTAIQGFDLLVAVYNNKTGKYEYSSSIYNLIDDKNIPIDKNAVVLLKQKTDDKGNTTFIYDITNLKNSLKKLAEKYDDNKNLLKISQNKIAFAAVDYAYNRSEIKLCDTIVYDDITLKFVDKDGNPVSGVQAEINSRKFTSDKDGKIIYENIPAGEYKVKLTEIPNNLCIENNPFNTSTGESSKQSIMTIKLMPEGTYQSKEENSSASQHTSGEYDSEQKPSKDLNPKEPQPEDIESSIYALIFVAALLAISIAAFLISKKKFKL